MTHADTINALRTWGHHDLADDLVRTIFAHDPDEMSAIELCRSLTPLELAAAIRSVES